MVQNWDLVAQNPELAGLNNMANFWIVGGKGGASDDSKHTLQLFLAHSNSETTQKWCLITEQSEDGSIYKMCICSLHDSNEF